MFARTLVLSAVMLVACSACEEDVQAPDPPVADPPAYTSCTITYSGIVTEQEYYSVSWAGGREDTLEHRKYLDTLDMTTLFIDGLVADGYVLTGSIRRTGYRLTTYWDSTRSVRAEFDAQNGKLLLLRFEHGDGSSMRSPGGLDFEDDLLVTVLGEGFKAGSAGEFLWDSAEESRTFFHTVKQKTYVRSQSTSSTATSIGMDFLEGSRIEVRFH